MPQVVRNQQPLRLPVLDGWRACSILLVLAGHLLPIGPRAFQLNEAAASAGMALFFILSGFLITRCLVEGMDLQTFLIRRLFRIVPLAWITMFILLIAAHASPYEWLANLLFFANLPPAALIHGGNHLWSLCVEMQFYVGVAMLVWVAGQIALYALPILSLIVTSYRIYMGTHIDIITWLRIDEILAGCTLALIASGWLAVWLQQFMAKINTYFLLVILLLSCDPYLGPLTYARPYIAMLTIGSTLYRRQRYLRGFLESGLLAYIATISYALYIIHGVVSSTWLGSGDSFIRYIKRPLLIAITFGLAHLSTFYFERRCITLGKWLGRRNRQEERRLQASETRPA
jgi:peptidoglycan/LPS O-acetylase OafA/YrhL